MGYGCAETAGPGNADQRGGSSDNRKFILYATSCKGIDTPKRRDLGYSKSTEVLKSVLCPQGKVSGAKSQGPL